MVQENNGSFSTSEAADSGEVNSGRRRNNAFFAAARLQRKQQKEVSERRGETRAALITTLVDFNELKATILLVIASAGTAMLTYFGVSVPMSELGGGLLQKGQSLAFAITIGVFSYLGWMYSYSVLPYLRGWRLFGGAAALLAYVSIIACIDAPFNMVALGGGTGVQMSLDTTAKHHEQERLNIVDRATAAKRVVPTLRSEAARFRELSSKEITTGSQTSKPGKGKVSDGYAQIATLLTTLADQIEERDLQAQAVLKEHGTALGEMKSHVFTRGPIRERVEATSKAADRLGELASQLEQLDGATAIRSTISSLENIFPIAEQAGSAFEKVQNSELAIVAGMAKAVAKSLQVALEDFPAKPKEREAPSRPEDPMTAIKTYWKPLLPQWIAAIFIDIAPALLLIVLLVGRREAEATDQQSNAGDRK